MRKDPFRKLPALTFGSTALPAAATRLLLAATAALVAAVILTSAASPAAAEGPDDSATARLSPGPAVTTDYLNLRKNPSLQAKVLLVIPMGARVKITGTPQNAFFPVIYNGVSGWSYGRYLDTPPVPPPVDEQLPSNAERVVRQTLRENGLGHEWSTAAEIIQCESSWNPLSVARDSNGYYSRGLWQINDKWYGSWWQRFGLNWRHAGDNTEAAIRIYRMFGNSWRAWSCARYGAPPEDAPTSLGG